MTATRLAEAAILEVEAAESIDADPTWRKRMNDQAWRRNRGRPVK